MEFFKIYCHLRADASVGATDQPLECSEVSVQASPRVLRQIATFFEKSARTLEESKEDFAHVHFQDDWKEWRPELPDLIAICPPKERV
jgi:hypothetical protein